MYLFNYHLEELPKDGRIPDAEDWLVGCKGQEGQGRGENERGLRTGSKASAKAGFCIFLCSGHIQEMLCEVTYQHDYFLLHFFNLEKKGLRELGV